MTCNISTTIIRSIYISCVHICMLHGSETWPVKKLNELTLQRAEMGIR